MLEEHASLFIQLAKEAPFSWDSALQIFTEKMKPYHDGFAALTDTLEGALSPKTIYVVKKLRKLIIAATSKPQAS